MVALPIGLMLPVILGEISAFVSFCNQGLLVLVLKSKNKSSPQSRQNKGKKSHKFYIFSVFIKYHYPKLMKLLLISWDAVLALQTLCSLEKMF
jgi:hypothetical protein